MEGLSINAYKGIQGYWKKRRGYERLSGPSSKAQRKARFDRLATGPQESPAAQPRSAPGGVGRRRRRIWRWRIKIRRPKIRVGSPKKWLVRLRDAYVNMMLRFANSAVFNGGYGATVQYGNYVNHPIKEYDEKVLVEIYKSVLMSQGKMVHRDAPELGSQTQVVC